MLLASRSRRLVTMLAGCGLLVAACTPAAPPAPTSTPAAPAPKPTTSAQVSPAVSPAASSSTAASPAAATRPAPAASGPSGPLIEASLANLSPTLHPYPDSASYTSSYLDAATLIWGGGDGGGGLLAFDWNQLDYRPAMATGMPSVSADGKTYTFTLRQDLKWSDGSPITVDDFLFAWDNASKKENDFVGLDQLQEIAAYRSPGPNTIEVTLTEPKPRDVALGTVSVIGPVPRKVWENKPWNDPTANPEINNPSVVLGPFKVQDYRVAEQGTFVPVDTYYVGKPRLPQVQILAGQQPTVAYEALRGGRANYAPAIPPSQYTDAKANPDLNVLEWTPANAAFRSIDFNLTRPFLSDKRVREALARAVNREDVLELAEQGLGTPQYSFIQPTNQKWVNPNVEHYDFDLSKARQLLQDAGYQQQQGGQLMGKDNQPVKLQVVYPTSSAPRAKIAAYLQQSYKELGIEVEVKGLDFNAYTDQVQKQRDFDLNLQTWGGGTIDPDLVSKPQLITGGQQNTVSYSNPQVDQLFKQAGGELDEPRRKQLYDQLQQAVNADLPSHYLYAVKAFSTLSKKVQGAAPNRGDRLEYNDALLAWSVAQ
jgi:peptide/nickel transport system substrate-binding protein